MLSDSQREVLERLVKSRTAPHREVVRAEALRLAAHGLANTAIASRLGVSPSSVAAWRKRFGEEGLAKFGTVRSGRGRKPSISAAQVQAIVEATLHTKPPGETHWSCRTMAKAQRVSPATVQRIWSARGLQPHRVETFKLSSDLRFEEKLVDVVGLKETSKRTKMPSPNILRALNPKHNPTLETLNRLLQPFGLKLSVTMVGRKPRRTAA